MKSKIQDKFSGDIPDLKGKVIESVEVEGLDQKIRFNFQDGTALGVWAFFEKVQEPGYPHISNLMRFAVNAGYYGEECSIVAHAPSATARAESENAPGESQTFESSEGAGRVPRSCSALRGA